MEDPQSMDGVSKVRSSGWSFTTLTEGEGELKDMVNILNYCKMLESDISYSKPIFFLSRDKRSWIQIRMKQQQIYREQVFITPPPLGIVKQND